jgi:hemerythrin-like domain-containing protein
VPPLPEYAALDQTHRQALEMLEAFVRLLQHLDDNGLDAAAQTAAREIMGFFSGPGQDHHAAEEALVFPHLLAAGDASLVQHVRRLQQDHGWIDEDWRLLAPQVEAIATGYNWVDLPMLQHALPVFTALYHEHIALEETVVYPAAQALRRAELAAQDTRRPAAG